MTNNDKHPLGSSKSHKEETTMQVQVAPKQTREPVLYARVKEVNHSWMQEQARANNYKSVSEFTDALIDGLRTGTAIMAKESMTEVQKTALKKKAVKKNGSRKSK